MGQFQPRTREQILERMISRVVARSDLTDLNDGSDVKQVLAAAAREDDDTYFQMLQLLDLFDIKKAVGNDLDERAKEFNPALVSRNPAQKAVGEVVFNRAGTVGTVTIPIGTQVTVPAVGSQAQIVFVTTEEGTIADTFQASNLVDIVAEDAGTVGNVGPTTIIGFVAKPSGVDTVSNPSALTNGRTLESDDEFRRRLVDQIKGLASAHPFGLQSAALTAVDTVSGKRVVFAHVVEDALLPGTAIVYIDDGAGTAESTTTVVTQTVLASAIGGETVLFLTNKPVKTTALFKLYVNAIEKTQGVHYSLNPASGQINFLPAFYPTGLTAADAVTADYTYYTGLIALTQKIIDGDPADRANFPGKRSAGILVRVLVPTIIQQIVTADITVLQGFSQVDVAIQVRAAISTYINGLGISDDVILNELKERAMAVAGMYDVSFTAPTGNQIILDTQLARIIAGNLTIA
jgi:uncharacterized phage protein gp47/JayE